MLSIKEIVGVRVRSRRKALSMTVAKLAERSGLSARYILSAEKGVANLSLEKLEQLCNALDLSLPTVVSRQTRGELDGLLSARTPDELTDIAAWIRATYTRSKKPLVALLGVRGAGKTAVGKRLASHLNLPFDELDKRIEDIAELSLAEIFALHGEQFYRQLESTALNTLVDDGRDRVVATGGGLVTDPQNFARLKNSAVTIWLKATAEDHWDRVIDQGDNRPMRDHPQAMAQLRQLMETREPLYGQADYTVTTTGRSVDEIVHEIRQVFGDC
ncbi:MAG: transcriptional regulator [Myxococcales bacterium]|nr:transcriptional regulator [Myxococcales bacterium]